MNNPSPFRRFLLPLLFAATLALTARANLQADFQSPPPDARPWVFWFWNNANVTSNGITADLTAMQHVGIGGVLIMDVVERYAPPRGPAEFMNPEWRHLFEFSVQEAHRLGLKVNMANGPGWCGSSGPWITPELSMQKIVWTNLDVTGPTNLSLQLPQPESSLYHRDDHSSTITFTNFYKDIALLAYPKTNGFAPHSAVIDLSAKMDADGRLTWDVPAGDWIIDRIGATSTGASTRPPVAGGNGLECDKLSAAAMDVHFTNMIGRLAHLVGPLAGTTFVATHIDSWESGWQNWTPKLREEFIQRRGYDPLTWLPCAESFSERVRGANITHYYQDFDNADATARFRWDFNQTISELLAQNYVGELARLAHTQGLRLTIEGYDLPFGDEGIYSADADEPMTEFWTSHAAWANGFNFNKAAQMASVAHTTGKSIVGAEAFTSDEHERWTLYPATIKALGDYELAQGVNRFVFHRYAHQPYLDRYPGVTMGPWGLHYERTETWWNMSRPWHEYLARCQFLLRQGKYVAQICYLRPELPNQTYFTPDPAPPAGYRYDQISADDLINNMTVENGRVVLPDGMSYRLLVLPNTTVMTPALARKIKELVIQGATVYGPRPVSSPSLQDFPECDAEVGAIGIELWDNCDGTNVTEHAYGNGRVIDGKPLDQVLERELKTPPDFLCDAPLAWIHRSTTNAEIYFVANTTSNAVTANCLFAQEKWVPEIWDPQTGEVSAPTNMNSIKHGTMITFNFAPGDSTFVVFRPHSTAQKPFVVEESHPLLDVDGKWRVTFPPKWGAPSHITLTNLISWTDYPEDGVKYFSGTATYHTEFESKFDLPRSGTNVYLDLGNVAVMAHVWLNDKDCGIAWRPPYRVDVTDALRRGKNELKIEVANLWPNRMIGDSALPEGKRVTWSTWEPFKPGMPLLTSGLLGPVRLLPAMRHEPLPFIPETRLVSTNTMAKIFNDVKTPYKYGVVLKGESPDELVDCPSVFRYRGHWYMMFVANSNKVGYQTWLARSDDLLHWQRLGRILSFTGDDHWDAWQADGGIALADDRWNGSHELEKFDGKYWLSYIGGAKQGYETDPLSTGIAWTTDPVAIHEWHRLAENPVLTGHDLDVRDFEKKTLYKTQIIHDRDKTVGHPFVMYYNGKTKNGFERIGMAVSDDMVHWKRYGDVPVVANGEAKGSGISGDPQIVRIGDVWTMFYFGAGWKPHAAAFDTFACSYDLTHWTQWTGPNLIQPSEPYDKSYAHKPWVLKWKGVVYHFYCAVGTEGRVIALATSKDMRKK